MKFIQFNTESTEYQQALELRQQVLRIPVGLNLYDEDLSVEKNQLHFGLLLDDQLTACITAIPLDQNRAKIRQMAVSTNFQRKGFGKQLFESCIQALKDKGISEVVLDARSTAVEFYKKAGFSICSEEFTQVKVPHYKMSKKLY